MPALPPAENTVKVVFTQTDGLDNNIENRLFLVYSGVNSDTIMNDFASQAAGYWLSNLAPVLSEKLVLTSVECTDLTSSTAPVGVWTGTNPGGDINGPVPSGATLNTNFQVARRYRGGHPRWYQSLLTTDKLTDDLEWSDACIASWTGVFGAFLVDLLDYTESGLSFTYQANVSYFEGFTPHQYPSGRYRNIPNLRATPLIDQIVGWTVQAKVGSQRRRNELHS